MTNKTELLERLAAKEKKIHRLRDLIEAPEHDGLWRPEVGEKYFYVSASGKWEHAPNVSKYIGGTHIYHGNCYQTEKSAEAASPFVSTTLKVCAAALQADPDAGPWSADRGKMLCKIYNTWRSYEANAKTADICMHTYEQADKAADILNAEGV